MTLYLIKRGTFGSPQGVYREGEMFSAEFLSPKLLQECLDNGSLEVVGKTAKVSKRAARKARKSKTGASDENT